MTIKTSSQLTASITSDLADNNTGEISAEDVRQNLLDIVDSVPALAVETLDEDLVAVTSVTGITGTTGFSYDSATTTLSVQNLTLTGANALILSGSATVFDDLMVPIQQGKKGSNDKPDYDWTNNGYLFPNNDATEILYLNVQIPHWWKEGSAIYPHVHWNQSANQIPVFKIDYRWFNLGAAVPSQWTTYTMSTQLATYVTGTIGQISKNATGIDGTGKTISSILQIKLYRQDSAYTGDCLVTSFDIHLEKDSLGSKEEYNK